MARQTEPGVDRTLVPRMGVSRGGQPLSYNRLPAADLTPWVGWLYATRVDAPADYELSCSLLNDTSMIRIQLDGDWEAETRDGTLNHGRAGLYFGPQSKAMPIKVRGSFISVGMALKPGVGHALFGMKLSEYVDRIVPGEEIGLPIGPLMEALDPKAEPEVWLQTLEAATRSFLANITANEPDPVATSFEFVALTDPTVTVSAFAREYGISTRQLERICLRDFGLAPKQVLRRARALDMASALRGVADNDEAVELELRYHDQSHMNREFTELFGMTPRQFVATPQPLMTLALESRQSRRLAVLDRLPPDQRRPWEQEK